MLPKWVLETKSFRERYDAKIGYQSGSSKALEKMEKALELAMEVLKTQCCCPDEIDFIGRDLAEREDCESCTTFAQIHALGGEG